YDWWVIGREGGLKRLGGAQTATLQAAAPPASGAYELNDYRYHKLMADCEPDMLLAQLYEQTPELLTPHQPSTLYEQCYRYLRQLDEAEIKNDNDRLSKLQQYLYTL
ncbi:hypothetical protein HZU77_000005, partial [Neisseriaceae bacterium TC5R-5]|nr:hypothetical protein [Neisseriaceae bacterium TC5R-5]